MASTTEADYKKLKVAELKVRKHHPDTRIARRTTPADLTPPSSQDLLKSHALPVSGNKPDLVARLLEFDAGGTVGAVEGEAAKDEAGGEMEVDRPEAEGAPEGAEEAATAPQDTPTTSTPARAADPVVPAAPLAPKQQVEATPAEVTPSTSGTSNKGLTRPRDDDTTMEESLEGEHESKRIKLSSQVEEAKVVEQVVVEKDLPVEMEKHEEALVEAQEEEQEPPTYDFPPEELDASRPTDMYLDTVRSFPLAVRLIPN